MNRLLVRHARLLDPASRPDTTGRRLLEGEQIAAVSRDWLEAARNAEMVTANALCLVPALADMCVQLREPGVEHLEIDRERWAWGRSGRGHDLRAALVTAPSAKIACEGSAHIHTDWVGV
jgi:hypothetical protein